MGSTDPRPKCVRPTKNQMGWMFNAESDDYMRNFAEFVAKSHGVVADLGCAYGDSTKLALRAGGSATVIANDLCQEHLEELWTSLANEPELQKRLTLLPGNALDVDLGVNSLDAILAANWLHFLTPDQVRLAVQKFYDALKPGGRLFLVAVSTRSGLHPESPEAVARRRLEGELWPGLCRNGELRGPQWAIDQLPSLVLHLDPVDLEREAELAGFVVEEAGYSQYENCDMPEWARTDGCEFSGLIARKPEQNPCQMRPT